MATSSGRLAGEMVARAHAAKRGLTPAEQRQYTRTVKRHAAVFQKLIAAFYDEDSFNVFMCGVIPYDMSRGLTSIVAGYATLNWALWWRYKLFLTVCRLQRYWKVVKRPESELAALARIRAQESAIERTNRTANVIPAGSPEADPVHSSTR